MAKEQPSKSSNSTTEARRIIEEGTEQAKKSAESFMGSAQQAASNFQEQTTAAQTGAKEVGEKVLTFTERNISATLQFGQRLLQAKDVSEVIKLQTEYVSTQMQAVTEQAKELAETTSRAMGDATKLKR